MLYHFTALPKNEIPNPTPIGRYMDTLTFLDKISKMFPNIHFFLYEDTKKNPHIVAHFDDKSKETFKTIDYLEENWPCTWDEAQVRSFISYF